MVSSLDDYSKNMNRQTELLERKRQKKLRQKELKAKDQMSEEKLSLGGTADYSDNPLVAEISSPPILFDSDSNTLDVAEDVSSLEMIHLVKNDEDIKAFELGTVQETEPEQKDGTSRESKTQTETDKMQNDKSFWCMCQNKESQNKCEVMIGSISVPVKICPMHIRGTNLAKTQDHTGNTEPKVLNENRVSKMQNGCDLTLGSKMSVSSDDWVHVTRRGKGPKGRQDHEEHASPHVGDQNLSCANYVQSYAVENADGKSHSHQLPDCNTDTEGLPFSSGTVKTFLTKSMFSISPNLYLSILIDILLIIVKYLFW